MTEVLSRSISPFISFATVIDDVRKSTYYASKLAGPVSCGTQTRELISSLALGKTARLISH